VGACERVTETMGSLTTDRWLTYLTGPTGVYAVVETSGSTNTLHYVLKDNLGSWTTITDSDGNVEQRLSYDAWGNLRDPATWSGSFTGTPMFDRGFTGHEHLYHFGLINMNGRMYDPMMSSFLSVDLYVQDPTSAQGFNRYAYCGHNPLRYVDPSGWQMKPTPGSSPSSNEYYQDIYSYVERAYEPRDLGILQLSTDDPIVIWMEENELHGGGGSGGFYVNLASGLIEHHNGKTNVEYLKQGLLFLAVENASIGDIENALEQKGLSYQKDPNVLGGYLVDTEEMFKGYLLWQSIPSMTTVFALGSVECLFNSISLFLSSIKSIEKTTNISYEFTNATLNRMDDPARRVPLNILDEVIKNPQVVGPDPQGTAAKMYYSTIYKNGKLYNIEVLYKQSNNTIYHFLYSPSPLGPMPPIKP
jgi:RHS repeat-associated protein